MRTMNDTSMIVGLSGCLDYRFAGPRAEWLKLAAIPSSNADPHISVLEDIGVDPKWLDRTLVHRGRTWRIEGLHRSYRSVSPTALVIVADDGKTAQVSINIVRTLLTPSSIEDK